MSGEVLIDVESVSKKFCRSLKRSLWYGVKDITSELTGRSGHHDQLRESEFWAVKDVSFQVRRGECLGLIGRNGAGKTTLLRMLNGLIKPDQGKITMRGRVGALIALGAGFNPILTGRENVYAAGAVLGLTTKEIDAKYDDIVEFAEMEEFMETPVQTYSSGMQVRLGFAVAAQMEPDILILDEVLAVGDISFIVKCLNAVREIVNNTAVIFVSHSMQYISYFCSRAMVLEQGKALIDTPSLASGIDRYFEMVKNDLQVSGNGDAQVFGLQFLHNGVFLKESEPCIQQGTSISVIIHCQLAAAIEGAHIFLQINDIAMNALVFYPISDQNGQYHVFSPGEHRIKISLGNMDLNAGKYTFVVVVREAKTAVVLKRIQGLSPFRVSAAITHWAKILRPVGFEWLN